MSVHDNLEFLTPGSVWIHSKKGYPVKFLYKTNESLKAAVQLKHPPQIIYADMDANIFNRSVDDFLGIYRFHNVDGKLEQRLESLLQFNEADYAAVEDPEDDPAPEMQAALQPTLADELLADMTETPLVSIPEADADDLTEPSLVVTYAISQNEAMRVPPLTEADLQQNTVVYAKKPNANYNITEHVLTIKLGGKITLEALHDTFHPSQEINTVDMFSVKGGKDENIVIWDTWIGIYPEYTTHGLYASVYLGSEDNPVDATDTPGADAVEVPAAEVPVNVAETPVVPVEPNVIPVTTPVAVEPAVAPVVPVVAQTVGVQVPVQTPVVNAPPFDPAQSVTVTVQPGLTQNAPVQTVPQIQQAVAVQPVQPVVVQNVQQPLVQIVNQSQ